MSLLGNIDRTLYVEISYGFLFFFYISLLLLAIFRIKSYKSLKRKIRVYFRLFGFLIIFICLCMSNLGRIASFSTIFLSIDETLYEFLNIIPCNNLIVIGILIFFLSYEDYHSLSGCINSDSKYFKIKINLLRVFAILVNLAPRVLLLYYNDFLNQIKNKELWLETILNFSVSVGLLIMSILLFDRIRFLLEESFKSIVKNNIYVVIFIYILMLTSRIAILIFTIWELNGNIPEEDGIK